MNAQENSDKYYNWKLILDLPCQTQEKINITSYGDWGIAIRQRDANKVDRPMYEIMKENKMQWFLSYKEQDFQFVVQDHSHLMNVKQAFQKLTVNINISQDQFKNLYGFWQISDFTIYDRDGNDCRFSFRTKDKFYCGSYGTS